MSNTKNIIILIILISFIPLLYCESDSPDNSTETNITEEIDNTFITNDGDEEVNILDKLNYTNVMYLNDSNFIEELNKSEISFLLFYASWSDYCQQFMPIFIETADYCKDNNMNILFARIESEMNQKAIDEFSAFSYPVVFLIIKGRRHRYGGERTKEGLLNFLKKKLNNDVYNITRLEEINEYNNNSLTFLSTIKNTSSIIYKSFLFMAEDSFFYNYLSCISEECLKKYGEDIIIFKKFDEKENRYTKDYGKLSDANEDSFSLFISIFGIEAGAFMGPRQIDLLNKYDKKAIIYVRNSSNEEETKYDSLFKKLGVELRNNNTYVFVSDTGEKEDTNIGEAFSILPEDIPGIFYYNQNTGDPYANIKIYSYRALNMEKIDLKFIKNFITDSNNGKIKRDLYSEPPSESKIIDGLKYVVGRTFDRDVTYEKKNVFLGVIEDEDFKNNEIEFLGVLRNLTKIYEDIVFAYINVNKNEPRDLPFRKEVLPIGFLYTNAMEKHNIISFKPENTSNINQKELADFLDENIKKIKHVEYKRVKAPEKGNEQTDL